MTIDQAACEGRPVEFAPSSTHHLCEDHIRLTPHHQRRSLSLRMHAIDQSLKLNPQQIVITVGAQETPITNEESAANRANANNNSNRVNARRPPRCIIRLRRLRNHHLGRSRHCPRSLPCPPEVHHRIDKGHVVVKVIFGVGVTVRSSETMSYAIPSNNSPSMTLPPSGPPSVFGNGFGDIRPAPF